MNLRLFEVIELRFGLITISAILLVLLQTGSPNEYSNKNINDPSLDGSRLPEGWQRIVDLPRQVNDFARDPNDPKLIYAGAGLSGSGSGVYKSEDAGLTWNLASSGLPTEDVSALAVHHGNSDILHADVGVRGDIFASEDGANSWRKVGNCGVFGSLRSRLYSAPDNDMVLYGVFSAGGLIRSTNGGMSWQACDGGLPKSDDERIGAYVISLAIDPLNSRVIYAGTGGWVGQGHGVYKTVDGGDSWTSANRGILDYRITALAADPTDSQTIYAGSDKGEFFRSVDGGATWVDLTDRLPRASYSLPTFQAIEIDPADSTVYVLMDRVGLLSSSDGGLSWESYGRPDAPEDLRFTDMAISPGPPTRAVVCVERNGCWRYEIAPEEG